MALDTVWSVCLAGLATAVLGIAACGPSESPCEGVECDRGVCSEATGECVNPDACSPGEADGGPECLAGYSCVDGACQADNPCGSDQPCARGVCDDGACVNVDSCDASNDNLGCLEGFYCQDGSCVETSCTEESCERGVCEASTGECVDRETCPAEEGETPACIRGHKCYEPDNACYGPEGFCEEGLDCDRGVCSFALLDCVDADDCSSDSECLEGDYCTDGGDCRPNVCDQRLEDCPRGTCDPSTGECVNADSCDESEACLPNHWCIDGACVASEEACGSDGCPGNRVCSYDPEGESAVCEENPDEPCRDARDCREDRICEEGSCIAPTSCTEDSFELNDSQGDATDYGAEVEAGGVNATICSDDVDVYAVDVADSERSEGRFVASLQYAPRDVGLGNLEVRIVGPDGSTRVSETPSEETPGRVRVSTPVDADDSGTFFVEIRDDGDVGTAGVAYELFAGIRAAGVVEACGEVETLETGSTDANTQSGTLALETSCTSGDEAIPEAVYAIDIAEDSWVSLEVEPASGVDVAASLRTRCEATETERVCANRRGEASAETIERLLEPGTYYLVVQGTRRNDGGEFTVTYEREAAVCTNDDNRCLDDGTAEVCGSEGQELVEEECEFGCDPGRGVCGRAATDACTATGDASKGLTDEIVQFDRLEHEFDGSELGCLGSDAPTDGSDAVYRVDLDAGHVLRATLDDGTAWQRSLYLLDGCGTGGEACLRAGNVSGGGDEVVYYNDGTDSQRLYLVADTSSEFSGDGLLNVEIAERVCQPGGRLCDGSTSRRCNDLGTAFSEHDECPWGCSDGRCVGDVCETPKDVDGGGTWTIDPENFAGDYGLAYDNACINTRTPGPDVVYRAEVPAQGWLIGSVEVGSDTDTSPAIYIVEDCSSAEAQESTCLAGADHFSNGTAPVEYQNRSSSAETLYVVVAETRLRSRSDWEIDIQIEQPQCTPGTPTDCADGETLQYCGPKGLNQKSHVCSGSSSSCEVTDGSAKCVDPQGDICADAIPVGDGDTITSSFGGTDDSTLREGRLGECSVDTANVEADEIYRVDMQQDDLLTAELSTREAGARLYLLETCYRPTSCGAYVESSETLRYFADSSRTVYLVADRTASGSSGNFQVDFSVDSGLTCEPGTTSCIDSSTVGFCDYSGSSYEPGYTCESGTCVDGACETSTFEANGCARAPDLGSGSVVRDSFDEFTHVYEGSCVDTRSRTDGPDAYYKLDVAAGDLVDVSVDATDQATPTLYLFGDCADPELSCITEDVASFAGGRAEIQRTFDSAKTVYVGVDSQEGDSGEFELHATAREPACTPGASQCVADSRRLRFCEYPGRWRDHFCEGGCDAGTCGSPTGESCADPIELVGDGSTAQVDLVNRRDTFELEYDACTGDSTQGNDVLYTVEAQEGQTIDVEATPDDADDDPVVFVTKECSRLRVTGEEGCLAGSDDNGDGEAESLTYTVPSGEGGTYFVVVDAETSFDDEGTVDVTVDVQ